jgi:ankyrin repeat protein
LSKDAHGNTALHEAVRQKRADMVKLLIDNGLSSTDERNARGLLPEEMTHKKNVMNFITHGSSGKTGA